MNDRIHIILDAAEKERFRRIAARAGKSLSEWLRDVARADADLESARPRLDTDEELERFFATCDVREHGREPDWDDHLKVIRRSRAEGASET